MAKYRIVLKKSVAKDLRRIPNGDVQKVLSTIESLAADPRGQSSKKLKGYDLYRARVGFYRIVYEIRDMEMVVSVIAVGLRSDIYRRS